MGLPGTGKSFVSNYLHEKYGFTVLSGENITFSIFNKVDCTGQEYALEYDILRKLAVELTSQSCSIVVDGTNLKYIFRQQIYNEVNCKNTTLLYLKIDDKTALNRISKRGIDFKDLKNIKSQITPEIYAKFKKQLEKPFPSENFIALKSDKNILKNIDKIIGVK